MGVAMASCDGKVDPEYTTAEPVADAQRVFFASQTTSVILPEDETSFAVKIYRPEDNDSPELTVQILAQSPQAGVVSTPELRGVFTVPASVTFAEGEQSAEIVIDYNATAITPNQDYAFSIAIDEANADVYGIASTTIVANMASWTEWEPFMADEALGRDGIGSYTFSIYYGGKEYPVLCLNRYIPTEPGLKEFQFQWLIDNDNPELGFDTFLTAKTEKVGDEYVLTVPQQHFADNANYGAVYAEDTYSYSGNPNYKGKTFFDDETGIFTLNLIYYVEAGSFGNGNEYMVLNGFKDTNVYEVNVTDKGQISIDDNDYAIVGIDFTETVEFVNYTVVAEAIEDEETLQAIIDDMESDEPTVEISSISEAQNVALSFPVSGTYSVVAIGYAENSKGEMEAKASSYVTFDYTTYDPYLGWNEVTSAATYTDYLFPTIANGATPVDATVRVDASEEFEGLYRIDNPYKENPYLAPLGCSYGKFGYILYEVLEDGSVLFPYSELGISSAEGEWGLLSFASYNVEQGVDPARIPASFFGTISGNVLSMSASANDSQPSFLWVVDGNPYLLNMDFKLDLGQAAAPAAAPAKAPVMKAKAAKRMQAYKQGIRAAYYKAVPQGVVKNDRVCKAKPSRR